MEIEVHNIFSRTPNLRSLVCSWQSHVSAAQQKPGVIVLSLISPGCTSELWAVECQRNYPNCQGVPWLQAGQALGLPLHPGSISCVTLSLFPHLVTGSRFREPELGKWRNVVEKRGLSFHISVQWNAWSRCLRRKLSCSVTLLSWWAFPSKPSPLHQKFSSVAEPRSVAPGCCKLAESEWTQGWPGWIINIYCPVLYSRSSFIYFIYSSVYLLIPNSQLSLPAFPFGNHMFVFYVCESISVL